MNKFVYVGISGAIIVLVACFIITQQAEKPTPAVENTIPMEVRCTSVANLMEKNYIGTVEICGEVTAVISSSLIELSSDEKTVRIKTNSSLKLKGGEWIRANGELIENNLFKVNDLSIVDEDYIKFVD